VHREAGTEITAEEDSLAENVHRVALHPLDQFRAFQTLREQGRSEEDIAAIFFVSANVVKQRLRLVAVSPKLLDVYADDGMSLEQLIAFSVTADHARQEQLWENVNKSGYDEPYQIRRLLTERAVRASDKRARFVGLPAYEAAGGNVLRDLFEEDGGGWLEDVVLLERLVADKLRTEAETVAAENWKWIEVATNTLACITRVNLLKSKAKPQAAQDARNVRDVIAARATEKLREPIWEQRWARGTTSWRSAKR
jgi:ParB family chromosome partitioning protein